ncbi:MAG: GNAT family N-acetyltransferase [Oceanospirillaceae bacterium]|uniref:GNAT family N-acetyltransferase n=1 Tax=unclassified Thalassolituus TaxID=2624967 RepID=UPI000C0A647F|nr:MULTISPECIES: GNAT family N-acetyltransferase [unclassified Thalassolituus]MAK90007.1 GNAT family N-acetyltransferase [Thalassolituus sp.]MAS25629.1 GNAT family N-acetyltransferase [Oceanospirillaceae bacterium]MAX98781.1 GNAT family N-acetyltransferase [Oceanospirillaceae bacterium]MBL35689.1 GNAT family N-acetyltransferase [Oceanospirillaceae bacterium]MBS52218.1 GNAT family N-acetyltransferase [Oceanospirillaceae bacterium]|tara:strand:- start:9182 stop:9661 length:480 start_codon:yes stop_codon:yes gene_type:complete
MEDIIISDLSQPEHGQAVLDLLTEYAHGDTGGGEGLPEYSQQNLIAELQSRSNLHVILAFVNDYPAALLIAIDSFSTFTCKPILNIHDVIVSAGFRGQGLAKRILAKAEELALIKGCGKLTLEVLEGNTTAQKVYTDMGFANYQLDPEMGRAMFWQKVL